MKSSLSVIICTHNPRPDYLRRVLDALKAQTLPKDQWELLLVDNASEEPLAETWDLSWHPRARHLSEDELGLTAARLRGIKESNAELLLFVDDDNVLSQDYLASSENLACRFSWLGAIGGQILPEYETPPPAWFLPYEQAITVRRATRAVWSNSVDDWHAQPWGAGMLVRANVCRRYRELLATDPIRSSLGRRGRLLVSGEDTDIVLTCRDLDLGFGVFPELVVTHLIPPTRVSEQYLLKIIRGLSTSHRVLCHLHGSTSPPAQRRTFYTELRQFYHFLRRRRLDARIEEASLEGERDAHELIKRETRLDRPGSPA